MGESSPLFPLHLKYTDNRTDPEGSGSSSGAGAVGVNAQGGGLFIENLSTTDGSWAGVTFRTDTADARIAYQSVGSSLSNEGQMSFYLDTNDSNDDVYTLEEVLRLRGGNSNGSQAFNSVDLPVNDARLRLGASQQLELKFDGSHTRITHDAATDSWMIFKNEDGAGFQFNIGSDKGIEINKDGNVELYYDNSKKIETTTAGGTVSGVLTTTSDTTGLVTGIVVTNTGSAGNSATKSGIEILNGAGTDSSTHIEQDAFGQTFFYTGQGAKNEFLRARADGTPEVYLAGGGILTLATSETTVVDGDKLGRLDFKAPAESSGTDAILVGASIWAEADDTFAADNNSTDLVFATGASEAAAEKMRLTHDGYLLVGKTAGQASIARKLEVHGTIAAVDTGAGGGVGFHMANSEGEFLIYTDGGNLTVKDYAGSDTYPFKIMGAASNDTLVVNTGGAVAVSGALTVGGDLTVTGNDIKSSGGTTAITLSSDDVTIADNLTVSSGNYLYVGDSYLRDDGSNLKVYGNSQTQYQVAGQWGAHIFYTQDGSGSAPSNLTEVFKVNYLGNLELGNNRDRTVAVSATAHDAAGKDLTISAGDTTAGTTDNIAGGDLILEGGQGKGSGAGGHIIFKVANAGSSGSTLNSVATALTIEDDTNATFANDVTISGDLTVTGKTITSEVETVSTSNGVVFEGSASNAYEVLLKAGTVSADRTITLPDATGTVALTSTSTYTAGTGLDLSSYEFSVDVSDFLTNGDDNRVVTATGADGLNAEASLTYSGTDLKLTSATPRIYISDSDESSSSSSSFLLSKSGTNSYVYDRQASTKLYLGASDDNDIIVIVGDDKYVGVGGGVTSPDAPLHIKATADNSGGYKAHLRIDDSGTAFDAANNGGAITFGGLQDATNIAYWAKISGEKANTTEDDRGGKLKFWTRKEGGSPTQKMVIDEDGHVGIGTADAPHGGTGFAMFAMDGTNGNGAAGPHVQYTTASDNYPLFQQLNWQHDNIAMSFDAYYDGSWRSSDAGSNFQFYKLSDTFNLKYDSGISAGSAVTWNTGLSLNTSGAVNVPGAFSATTKSFVIEHPTKEGMTLEHGSLEGPEHGVYVRGKLEKDNVIELPDYWTGLVDADSVSVQLTPNKSFQQLYVEKIEDNKVYVKNTVDGLINCFFFIQAERKDTDKMVVEY
jgi:hypothetical protein